MSTITAEDLAGTVGWHDDATEQELEESAPWPAAVRWEARLAPAAEAS